MKQQTAVEWYANELLGLMVELATNTIAESEYHIKRRKAFEQAKQMEKEQIIDAHYQGYRNDIGTTEISEQYYNKTFTSTPQGETP